MKIKKQADRGLFDDELRLQRISTHGDPLEKLNRAINFEIFRPILEKALQKEQKGPGGRPAYDPVVKFKMLIVQRLYNISDDQLEYQVVDRLSFMRFLGFTLADEVPDRNTIWIFREQLKAAKVIEELFNLFTRQLENKDLIAQEGSIVDASFVEVPKQRNKKEDNDKIKAGTIPEDWKNDETKKMLSHKDIDARWTKKNHQNFYGYKDHIKIDSKSKFITRYTVTDASVHDSQELKNLITEDDAGKPLYGDSGYVGQEETLERFNVIGKIHEKGYRNRQLTEQQRILNKEKSRTRARVEHIFGFIETTMKGSCIRTIGKQRAEFMIGMINLTYNLCRFVFKASRNPELCCE